MGILSGYAISLVAWSWYTDCTDCSKVWHGDYVDDDDGDEVGTPPLSHNAIVIFLE